MQVGPNPFVDDREEPCGLKGYLTEAADTTSPAMSKYPYHAPNSGCYSLSKVGPQL
jgi:hypothetical protein